MSPEIFFQIIVNGLFTGGIYALVAVGLTLIYGVMVIVNFAHGEFFMVGANHDLPVNGRLVGDEDIHELGHLVACVYSFVALF